MFKIFSEFYRFFNSFIVFFFLRREPYYHKLQYSKVPKFDVAAALFGVIVSAFVGYLTLSTLGSAGADLTDMLVCVWYTFLTYKITWFFIFLLKDSYNFFTTPFFFFWFIIYF